MKNKVSLSRRQLLILASGYLVAAPLAALAEGIYPDIHVVKNHSVVVAMHGSKF